MSNSKETENRPTHSQAKRALSLVGIAAIALVFAINWGPGSRGCDTSIDAVQQDAAATVNGKEIPLRAFSQAYGQQLNQLRSQGIPAELAKQFGMHKQVLDGLVSRELLAQAAEQRGLAASDEDLKLALLRDPSFHKDGTFDPERYKEVVRNYVGVSEVEYEQKLRRELSAQRMLELIESAAVVSDDEVKARYQKDGNTAKATFVRFAPAMYADKVAPPKPAELDAWAATHGKEIADFYDLNKISYFQPERVKARQILLKVNPDATPAQKEEVKARAENLRKDLVDNKKSFAEVATQFSEDLATKEKGGDLGLIERLQVPGNFADVLFALQPGEVSKAVETPMGWHLGVVEEKKPPEQKPLDSVKGEIAAQLYVKDKARELARAAAQKGLDEAKKGKKLSEVFPPVEAPPTNMPFAAPTETKPEAKESGEFTAGSEQVPQLGAAPEVAKAVFAVKAPGLLEQVLPAGEAFAVVLVTERKEPSDADFEGRKAELKLQAVKAKQFEVREAFLKALKQTGTVVTNDKAIDRIIGEG